MSARGIDPRIKMNQQRRHSSEAPMVVEPTRLLRGRRHSADTPPPPDFLAGLLDTAMEWRTGPIEAAINSNPEIFNNGLNPASFRYVALTAVPLLSQSKIGTPGPHPRLLLSPHRPRQQPPSTEGERFALNQANLPSGTTSKSLTLRRVTTRRIYPHLPRCRGASMCDACHTATRLEWDLSRGSKAIHR